MAKYLEIDVKVFRKKDSKIICSEHIFTSELKRSIVSEAADLIQRSIEGYHHLDKYSVYVSNPTTINRIPLYIMYFDNKIDLFNRARDIAKIMRNIIDYDYMHNFFEQDKKDELPDLVNEYIDKAHKEGYGFMYCGDPVTSNMNHTGFIHGKPLTSEEINNIIPHYNEGDSETFAHHYGLCSDICDDCEFFNDEGNMITCGCPDDCQDCDYGEEYQEDDTKCTDTCEEIKALIKENTRLKNLILEMALKEFDC